MANLEDLKFAILGAGNGGHAMAADLALAGHEVRLFDLERFKATPIERLEEEINELVYKLYGLNEDDKVVIEDYLKKF